MNILDEGVPPNQRRLLRSWRVPIRHLGYEVGRKGMKDDEIIRFLHGIRRPTLFTLDWDFYRRSLCHARYCLVYMDVGQCEAATFVRRLLRHRELDTEAKRMGTVIGVSHVGISMWRVHAEQEARLDWTD